MQAAARSVRRYIIPSDTFFVNTLRAWHTVKTWTMYARSTPTLALLLHGAEPSRRAFCDTAWIESS